MWHIMKTLALSADDKACREQTAASSSAGNISVDGQFMTSVPGIFAVGDSVRGASLIVWAIQEGQQAAQGIHAYLQQTADS